MLFNSIEFAIFLPIVFVLYWFFLAKKLYWQNLLVIVASYVFYGWWDWRFLSLIIISSSVDYLIGIQLSKTQVQTKRKVLLVISLVVNLGFLGFFKYYNFFIDSFIEAFASIGVRIEGRTLNILLPVGISFYTFQTLSYTIDAYRKRLEPTKDFLAFFAFVAFFPQLVAGPIERATNLLPQFYVKRKFDSSQAKDGIRQILWGLFKKIVIADNAAEYANIIFDNSDTLHGSVLLLGTFYFAFQIYGDFSGYSDIAIGTAKLFGFNLMRNFAYPYFARDIAEFWRRWHISLSTWFRDYLYIPLGGSRGSIWVKLRNVIIIFTVSGFWHGANWTFIVWGFINGIYFIPLMLRGKNRVNMSITGMGRMLPSIKELLQILATFFLTLLAWVFFRAENIGHAFRYIRNLFSEDLFTIPDMLKYVPLIVVFVIIEWISRDKKHALENLQFPRTIRWGIYCFLIVTILLFGQTIPQEFIYFQF